MEGFTSFLANNYIWFLVISLILLFALIGYLVDVKEMKNGKRRKQKEELKIVDFSNVAQGKSLNESIKEEKSELNLDEYAKKMETNETLEVKDSVESVNEITPQQQEDVIKPTIENVQDIVSSDQPVEELPNLDDANV